MGRSQTALCLRHERVLKSPLIAFKIFPLSLETSPNSFLHSSTLPPHTPRCFLRGKTLWKKRERLNYSNSTRRNCLGGEEAVPLLGGIWGGSRRAAWPWCHRDHHRLVTSTASREQQRTGMMSKGEGKGEIKTFSSWKGTLEFQTDPDSWVWQKWLELCRSTRWGMENAVRRSH